MRPFTRKRRPCRKHRLTLPLMTLFAFLSACSPLRTFNALIPKDRGSELVARGLPYGNHARQKLDIYQPADRRRARTSSSRPIIIFIYGGSWQAGEREGYGFVGRALAERGFLVVIPDYRLVPEVRFPGFLQDNASAFRWVLQNAARFGGDPSRIVLVGHSAGAYNAAMLALDPTWLGNEGRAVKGFIGLAGPYDFLPLDEPVAVAAFGKESDLGKTQPINFASADDPPSLLLHGSKDTIVYARNSQRLRDRLVGFGVDARMKLYDEIGHVGMITAFARPLRGRAPVLDDVVAFAKEVASDPATGQ